MTECAPTPPMCAKCKKHLGQEKEALLARLNFCGVYPKPYCDECYKIINPKYKGPKPTKKGFADSR